MNRHGPRSSREIDFCEDVWVWSGRTWERKRAPTVDAVRVYRRVQIVREHGGKHRVAAEWLDGRRVYKNIGREIG